MTDRSKTTTIAIWTAIPCVLFIALIATYTINNRPPNIQIPTHKVPKDNALDHYFAAGKLIKGAGPMSSPRPVDSWTIPQLEQFMADNAAAIAELRIGLTKPCVWPPIRSVKDWANSPYDSGPIRELARVMGSASIYYERTGRHYEAIQAQLDAVEMGASMPCGGTMLTGLVARAVEAIGMHKIETHVTRLDRAELASTADRLERIQAERIPYANIVLEEGRATTAMTQDISRRGPLPLLDSCVATDNSAGGLATKARFVLQNKTRVLLANQSYYKAVAAECRKPYTGKSRVPIPNNALAQAAAYIPVEGSRGFVIAEAKLTVLQTEVAILRYRADHSAYPTRLTDLTPKYLKKTPIDPFGQGKPLIYRTTNNGKSFLLYSRGPNLKDDGGTPTQQPALATQGDMVAGKLD